MSTTEITRYAGKESLSRFQRAPYKNTDAFLERNLARPLRIARIPSYFHRTRYMRIVRLQPFDLCRRYRIGKLL